MSSAHIQLPTGTSGHVVPFLDGDNIHSGDNRFSATVSMGSIPITADTRLLVQTDIDAVIQFKSASGPLGYQGTVFNSANLANTVNQAFVFVANRFKFINGSFSWSLATVAGDQTLSATSTFYQEYTGTGGHTWTLPARSGNVGLTFRIKNIGSGADLVISRAGADQIFSTSAVNTINVPVGTSVDLTAGNSFWNLS